MPLLLALASGSAMPQTWAGATARTGDTVIDLGSGDGRAAGDAIEGEATVSDGNNNKVVYPWLAKHAR